MAGKVPEKGRSDATVVQPMFPADREDKTPESVLLLPKLMSNAKVAIKEGIAFEGL